MSFFFLTKSYHNNIMVLVLYRYDTVLYCTILEARKLVIEGGVVPMEFDEPVRV